MILYNETETALTKGAPEHKRQRKTPGGEDKTRKGKRGKRLRDRKSAPRRRDRRMREKKREKRTKEKTKTTNQSKRRGGRGILTEHVPRSLKTKTFAKRTTQYTGNHFKRCLEPWVP